MKGKIIKGIAGFYYVHDGAGKVYECKAKGIFRNQNLKPLVGDDVEITVLDESRGEGNIDEILPRRNELVRPSVSNVDQALLLFSVASPSPNLNLMDRFLVMMGVQEIPVTVCFNKMDLKDSDMADKFRNIYERAGYHVLLISARKREGLEKLKDLIRKKTTVLAGPSGVGKSTITNIFQPSAQMETGNVSLKIQRGRHTTRHSELFCVEPGTYLVDTPGFSSMYLDDLEPEELKNYFPEFSAFEVDCRFKGCVHIGERDCGVKAAVAEGKIGDSRYDNYRLLYTQLKDKRRY